LGNKVKTGDLDHQLTHLKRAWEYGVSKSGWHRANAGEWGIAEDVRDENGHRWVHIVNLQNRCGFVNANKNDYYPQEKKIYRNTKLKASTSVSPDWAEAEFVLDNGKIDLFNNPLNPPVIVYDPTNQSHSQCMSVAAMSPVRICHTSKRFYFGIDMFNHDTPACEPLVICLFLFGQLMVLA
jgi:hypothetical protein